MEIIVKLYSAHWILKCWTIFGMMVLYLSTVYILSASRRLALSLPGNPHMKMKSLTTAAPGHHLGLMVGCNSIQLLSDGSYTSNDWEVQCYSSFGWKLTASLSLLLSYNYTLNHSSLTIALFHCIICNLESEYDMQSFIITSLISFYCKTNFVVLMFHQLQDIWGIWITWATLE